MIRKTTIILLTILFTFIVQSSEAQIWKNHSVLATGDWYKMAIANTGIYKISVNEIGGLNGVDINKIAIYGMEGGQLPMNNNAMTNDGLQECAIEIFDNNKNGIFDNNDYLLFYAEEANVWRYDQSNQFIEHKRNSYTSYNYYYLTTNAIQSARIETITTNDAIEHTITTYTAVGVIDNDITNTHRSGQIWVGERFGNGTRNRTVEVNMPSLQNDTNIRVQMGLVHLSTQNGRYDVTCNGTERNIYMQANTPYKTVYESFPSTRNGVLKFNLNYNPQEGMAEGYLNYIQVNAIAPLKYEGKRMDIWNNEFGVCQYIIDNYTNNLIVWDVTNIYSIKRIEFNEGKFKANTHGIKHFVAFTPTQTLTPHSINHLSNQDLHGQENVNMVIVTHPDFKSAAEDLANLHRINDGMQVLVTTPTEVFNEFSSGKQDPMAIRRLMKMMWDRYEADNSLQKPGYLLLFGRGTYDHRNILGNNKGCVVTYQSEASFDDERRSYCSDDVMGFMGENSNANASDDREISIGRLPAATLDEANLMVKKIERYMMRSDLLEDNDSRGDWRNFVTLLADDADPSKSGDTSFTYSSEYTAKILQEKYPYINIDKIYADAYIQQSGAIGSYYPDVNNALRNRINYGTILLNYVGHGSVLYIGTERYIEIPDIEGYKNNDRLAFFVTSTCSFGRYDNPEEVSGAEVFLLAKNAGIGCIAASRPIGHDKNFNTTVCSNMLDPNLTIGDALRIAKNKQYAPQSVTLFGDPALKLSIPQKKIVVTRINNHEISNNIADTGMVLAEVLVEGEIRNSDGSVDNNFNGVIHSIVYDRKQYGFTLANDNEGCNVPYSQQKNVLYKGRDTVINGHWNYSFIVPRDVAYQYDYGRLSHYARSGNIDAAGSYSNIVFGGFNQDADLTESRPEIDLYIGDSNFMNEGIVGPNPTIFAKLSDKIGINAFGSGLGHDITAILDNNPNNIIILNDFYETDLYDSRQGYINYGLDDLKPGWHTLTLKAWNIYNYSNSATIRFKVISNEENQVGRFYALPNPAHQQTKIHIEYNQPENISSVQVDIYNSQGQMVKSFTPIAGNGSYVIGPIIWDMTDHIGNAVKSGIYIARMIIITKDNDTLKETTKIIKIQ